jgi:hypothetical protein
MYPAWLNQRAQLSRPRVAVTRAIDERNVECYLKWRSKYERNFVAIDAWPPIGRFLNDRYYAIERRMAREWLIEKDRARIRQNALSKRFVPLRKLLFRE